MRNYLRALDLCLKGKNLYLINQNSLDWKKISMVFTGASPILEEEVEDLIQERSRFFLLSSDTSAYFLYKKKILPDAILSIDSGRGTAYHFREDLPESIPIITWLGGNTEIFLKKNPIYIYLSSFPLDQILALYLKEALILKNSGLNIATLALSMAEEFDCLDFSLAGVSFLSYKGKSHCRGTGYEMYKSPQINRKSPLESYFPGYYRGTLSNKNKNSLAVLQKSRYGTQSFKNMSDSIAKQFTLMKNQNLPLEILRKFIQSLQSGEIHKELSEILGLTDSVMNRYIKNLQSF